MVSIGGTRIGGNANAVLNYKCDQLAREILAEAIATDEDEVDGEARGRSAGPPIRLGSQPQVHPRRPHATHRASNLSVSPGPETAANVHDRSLGREGSPAML